VSSLALLTVTIEPLDEDRCRIRASGDLDLSTADRLSSALDAARADGVTTLLDLSAVSFIDSAGPRVLLRSARAVDAHNWAWFIVRASSAVSRLVRGRRHHIAAAAGGAAGEPRAHRDTQDCCSASRGLAGGPSRCPLSHPGAELVPPYDPPSSSDVSG
jgi:anti-anti-sigma factor